jgi:7-carboxy-7-deazaguanine synthase
MADLMVTEIYKSIQGESSWAGIPCTFIRLTGCPLRCRWCDTVYGFKGGKKMTQEGILDEVERLGVNLVELTGGEPLAQAEAKPLMDALVEKGYKVLIETSGSESLEGVSDKVHIIMDIKCPGSGMSDKNLWSNLALLKATDEIKFVIANKEDFEWAAAIVQQKNLSSLCHLLFSPAWGLVKPSDLVAWLLESKIDARLNLQLHKYIWSPRAKGV